MNTNLSMPDPDEMIFCPSLPFTACDPDTFVYFAAFYSKR